MIEFDGNMPDLVDPVAICAFEGWNDAGEAASNAVKHLAEAYAGAGRMFAALDGEDYYDYQVHRPMVAAVDDRRQVIWPTTRFSVVRAPARLLPGDAHEEPRDLVLVHGVEPNMRWRSFCEEVLGMARDLGVGQIITLGAYLADVPHTRPRRSPAPARTRHTRRCSTWSRRRTRDRWGSPESSRRRATTRASR